MEERMTATREYEGFPVVPLPETFLFLAPLVRSVPHKNHSPLPDIDSLHHTPVTGTSPFMKQVITKWQRFHH
jgi:hypothetical protein